jgi:2',3'-cyclic-nucleotide 2'-phosphodiesterase (5'-nucleotidase family)
MTLNTLAVDLGAESGRAMLGRFDGERLVLEELRSRADYLVFLVDCDAGRAVSLAALLPSIDLIAVAHNYLEITEPHQVANTLIATPASGGRLLSEIRIGTGTVPDAVAVTTRFVPLDKSLPDDPAMGELIRKAQAELEQLPGVR